LYLRIASRSSRSCFSKAVQALHAAR